MLAILNRQRLLKFNLGTHKQSGKYRGYHWCVTKTLRSAVQIAVWDGGQHSAERKLYVTPSKRDGFDKRLKDVLDWYINLIEERGDQFVGKLFRVQKMREE